MKRQLHLPGKHHRSLKGIPYPSFQQTPQFPSSLTQGLRTSAEEAQRNKHTCMALFPQATSALLLFKLYGLFVSCAGQDRLALGKSISERQTLTSPARVFALGFFTPSNSTATANRYLGIWYNNSGYQKTVVWVANRANPLTTNSSGTLRITQDGNLAVFDGNGVMLWSSNVSNFVAPSKAAASASLLDTGNFVLKDGGGHELWQSFDHPTDTLLQGMKLRFNFKTGLEQRLVAWRSSQDPSPGEASLGFDHRSPLQLVLLKGSQVLRRGGIWNGKTTITIQQTNSSTVTVGTFVVNDQEIYFSYAATELLSHPRFFLEPTGRMISSVWNPQANRWDVLSSTPSLPCQNYNRCGSFGTCDSSGNLPACKCLQGFESKNHKDWDVGNFTGGCVRQLQLRCDGGDEFVKFSDLYFPDHFQFLRNKTSELQCQAECSSNCNCTAYAYSNMSSGEVTDLRCLLWYGELKDLALDSYVGGDLYVRLVNAYDTIVQKDRSNNKKRKVLLTLVLPIVVSFVVLVPASYYCWMRIKTRGPKKNRKTRSVESEKDITGLPLIDFGTLLTATDNFDSGNKLGEGGFGPVYKGKLEHGAEIAVKRLSKRSGQGFHEFKNEIELIARLQHTNLVRLLGWCTCGEEKILVYEYLLNKSLDKFIFDPRLSAELKWSQRYCIIEGIAQGLLYLHRYSRPRIIHRDLKTSNILLDAAMNPKISDFGLARIFEGNQKEANTDRVVGTFGYMSPEYALDGVFSEKSDVFSFGVIVLEIVTGKRSTGFYPYKKSVILLAYVWQLWEEGRGLEVIDQAIGSSVSPTEVAKCIQLGLLCVQENAADRPTMSSVVSMLGNENATLPAPSHPAFAVGRHPNPVPANSPSHVLMDSLNGLTISVQQGR